MKPLFLLAASALALGAGGCAPKATPVRAALECPATQGDLTRTSIAADGKTCTYDMSGGGEVTLELVSTQGGVDKTLSAIETNLLANRLTADEVKARQTAEAAETIETAEKAETGEPPKTGASHPASVSAAEQAAAEAKADAGDATVNVRISGNRDHGMITERDGTTRVNLPGIHIVANENDETANVQVGPITVNAGGDGATVRMRRDVRLRGEALNPERRGLRATFLYTGKDLPDGYRFVGYEAGGPKAGPITVAVVKSKAENPNSGDIYPDVKKLVRRNGGV